MRTSDFPWQLPYVVGEECSIRDGLLAVDQAGLNVAVIVSEDSRLLGIATDGDLRRALLCGAHMDDLLLPYANKTPTTGYMSDSRAVLLDLMLSRGLDQIPVVDDASRLVAIHTLRGLLGRSPRSNRVLILAGGRGTRLGRATQLVPKPLLPVAGRPILERLIHHFVGFGLTDITLSVGYLAEKIEDHFGDGSQFGCRIGYLREDTHAPRGSGGPFLDFTSEDVTNMQPVLVTNGDLVTNIDVDALMADHDRSGADITIVVHSYSKEIPFGVVREGADGWVSAVEEKPLLDIPVNAGIYVMNPEIGRGFKSEGVVPMTAIIAASLEGGRRVRAFRSSADWLDVGNPVDLATARGVRDADRS